MIYIKNKPKLIIHGNEDNIPKIKGQILYNYAFNMINEFPITYEQKIELWEMFKTKMSNKAVDGIIKSE